MSVRTEFQLCIIGELQWVNMTEKQKCIFLKENFQEHQAIWIFVHKPNRYVRISRRKLNSYLNIELIGMTKIFKCLQICSITICGWWALYAQHSLRARWLHSQSRLQRSMTWWPTSLWSLKIDHIWTEYCRGRWKGIHKYSEVVPVFIFNECQYSVTVF